MGDPVVVVEEKTVVSEDQLPSLGDAELDKAIADQNTVVKEKETEPEPEVAPEVKTLTRPEVKAAEKSPEVKVETKPAVDAPTEDPVVALKKELETLKKKVQDKETFIQRQGTEIGELRKARAYYEEQAKTLYAQFQEKFYENPAEAMTAYNQSAQASQQAQQAGMMEGIQMNAQAIHQVYPDFMSMIDDIAKYGEAIGVPKEQVENFKRNPYATDVRALIPYVEGAKRMKQEEANGSLIEQLKKQVEELDEITDEETVVQKISAAAKKGPVITAKSGDGTTKALKDGLNENNIHTLSDADLEALLKES